MNPSLDPVLRQARMDRAYAVRLCREFSSLAEIELYFSEYIYSPTDYQHPGP